MKQFFILFVTTAIFVSAGEPNADEIAASYLKAIGVSSKSVQTLHARGIYVYNGLEHPLEIWKKDGDKVRIEIQGLQQYGTSVASDKVVIRAYDGQIAWGQGESREPGPQKLENPGSILVEAPLVSSLASYKKDGSQLELIGKADLEGSQVFHLKLTRKGGEAEDWYLDAKTYLPIKKSVDAGGMFNAHSFFFFDWRAVDGVMMPLNIEMEEGLFTRTYIFDEIKTGVKVDEDLFTMPTK